MTFSQIGEASGARAGAAGEARTARAYRSAQRHSALVRVLRVALIIIVFGTILVLLGKTLWRTFALPLEKLGVTGVSIDGGKITMDNPKLTGGRADGGGYTINAKRAVQDIRHPTDVDLFEIEGDITGGDKDVAHLTAGAGHYDTGKELITLTGIVRLRNSHYSVNLRTAIIDFKSGFYRSLEPVTVITNNGASITADSAFMRGNGEDISFVGHVRTRIQPGADEGVPGSMKGSDP